MDPRLRNPKNIQFALLVGFLTIMAFFMAPYNNYAMWFGFAIAGYSVIANDSIQTLGTLISSAKNISWGYIWLFTAVLLVAVLTTGWFVNAGDLSWGKLSSIPEPHSFLPLELIAPLCLLILTRLRFPVSTSFLVLSIFSSQLVIQKMLIKSFYGYVLSFILAFLLWIVLSKVLGKILSKDSDKKFDKKTISTKWRVLQFVATGYLWIQWLRQDIANVVVFLPRTFSLTDLIIVLAYLVMLLAFFLYRRGGGIQKIVQEKSNTQDVRVATLIDFCYGFSLYLFQHANNIPMSTTWVFLGILGGRELAIAFGNHNYQHGKAGALKLIRKDIFRALTGLLVSLIIVLFVVKF